MTTAPVRAPAYFGAKVTPTVQVVALEYVCAAQVVVPLFTVKSRFAAPWVRTLIEPMVVPASTLNGIVAD